MPGSSTCAVCGKAGKAVAFKEETMDKVCFCCNRSFVFWFDLIWFDSFCLDFDQSSYLCIALYLIHITIVHPLTPRSLSRTHTHTHTQRHLVFIKRSVNISRPRRKLTKRLAVVVTWRWLLPIVLLPNKFQFLTHYYERTRTTKEKWWIHIYKEQRGTETTKGTGCFVGLSSFVFVDIGCVVGVEIIRYYNTSIII